jgi:hypothetical protein
VTSLTGVLSIGTFVAALSLLRIPALAADALSTTGRTMATLREASDDRVRERAMQQASLRLARTFASMLIRTGLAAGAAFLPVGVAALAGLTTTVRVGAFLSRWEVEATATAVVAAGYFARTRWWTTS